MSTAVEVLMRQREAEKQLAPIRALLDRMASSMMKHLLDTRAPLIKYGRRKRGYRRLFPAEIAAMRIAFDGAGVKATPITNVQFYRQ